MYNCNIQIKNAIEMIDSVSEIYTSRPTEESIFEYEENETIEEVIRTILILSMYLSKRGIIINNKLNKNSSDIFLFLLKDNFYNEKTKTNVAKIRNRVRKT